LRQSSIKVLVFPGGTEIGLEIARALRYSKHFTPVGVNSEPDVSEIVYPEIVLGAPYAASCELPDYILRLCRQRSVEIVMPAHDEAIAALVPLRAEGLTVVGPREDLGLILRSKSRTYDALSPAPFVPRRIDRANQPASAFPLFARPDRGQGSVGARMISNEADLHAALSKTNPDLVTEYLPGAEYTVDCFSTADGRLVFHAPRERLRTRHGIAVRTRAVSDSDEFKAIGETINAKLAPAGAWFYQAKRDGEGRLKLMEVANRIAGTSGYNRLRGVNLVEMALFQAIGTPVAPPSALAPASFIFERSLAEHIKWDRQAVDRVYVDFDDTLVFEDGRLNHELVGLLYGLRANLRTDIVLITRHQYEIEPKLAHLGLRGLFSEIVHLRNGEPKAGAIDARGVVVFIDDSFEERRAVSAAHASVTCLGPESASLLAGALAGGGYD
jgi:hypothetical protein